MIIVVKERLKRRYRFRTFLWDLFMLTITGGVWIIWIIIRELKR